MPDEHGNRPLNNPDDSNLNRSNVTDHLAQDEHRWGMGRKWMRNHDKITRLIGMIATAATIIIFGAILVVAVLRQDSAVATDKELVKLARQHRQVLVELDCALDVATKLPGANPTTPEGVAVIEHRTRAYVRCLQLRGIAVEDVDNAVDRAIEETRIP